MSVPTDLPPLPTNTTWPVVYEWTQAVLDRLQVFGGFDLPELPPATTWDTLRPWLDAVEDRLVMMEQGQVQGPRGEPGPGGAVGLEELEAPEDEGLFVESEEFAWRWDDAAGSRLFVADGVGERLAFGDTGWRSLDVASVAGSIRDAAVPGELHVRRIGARVTVRFLGVGMTVGDGSGFIFTNTLPAGFRARDIAGPAVYAELGDTYSTPNRHRVHVTTDDIFWVGWSSHTGTFVKTRFAGRTLQGELSWFTDDAWPTSLPGTAI